MARLQVGIANAPRQSNASRRARCKLIVFSSSGLRASTGCAWAPSLWRRDRDATRVCVFVPEFALEFCSSPPPLRACAIPAHVRTRASTGGHAGARQALALQHGGLPARARTRTGAGPRPASPCIAQSSLPAWAALLLPTVQRTPRGFGSVARGDKNCRAELHSTRLSAADPHAAHNECCSIRTSQIRASHCHWAVQERTQTPTHSRASDLQARQRMLLAALQHGRLANIASVVADVHECVRRKLVARQTALEESARLPAPYAALPAVHHPRHGCYCSRRRWRAGV